MFYRLSDYIGLAVEKVQVEVVLTVKVWLGHLSHTFAVAASVHVVLAMLSFCLIIHKHKFLNKTIGDSEKYSPIFSWLLVLGGSLMITGVPPRGGGGGGVLPYMSYIGMCRCEGYGFQRVYSRIGYRNQRVLV